MEFDLTSPQNDTHFVKEFAEGPMRWLHGYVLSEYLNRAKNYHSCAGASERFYCRHLKNDIRARKQYLETKFTIEF